jgi:hypothetical protein
LGVLYYRAGELQQAVDALNQSMVVQNGGSPHDWFFLAMAHHRLGHATEARTYYDRAVTWMDQDHSPDGWPPALLYKSESLSQSWAAEASALLRIPRTQPATDRLRQ